MTRKVLWTPWRREYVVGEKSEECIFCSAAEPGDDTARLVAHRGSTALLILNRYPYTSGHMMVAPHRHVARLGQLEPRESREIWDLLIRAEALLHELYRPDGLNVGLNMGRAAGAGVADHLHWHLVPRWDGDANFMSVIGRTRVLPEAPEETYQKIVRGLALP